MGVDNIPTNAATFFNQNSLALMTIHYFKPSMSNKLNKQIHFSLKERRETIECELENKLGLTTVLLEVLGDRDLYILYRSHGFAYGMKSTLEAIGNEFGISRQRIHIIKQRSLDRLKKRAKELGIHSENLSA
jgi:DNA-directed RNA polymerase sigma subunit (sigma70/sigma32)